MFGVGCAMFGVHGCGMFVVAECLVELVITGGAIRDITLVSVDYRRCLLLNALRESVSEYS